MNILGLHLAYRGYDHDATAALICDSELIAVCEEERFNRVKTSFGFLPLRAIRSCLLQGQLSIKDIDRVITTGETNPDTEARVRLVLEHYFGHCPPVSIINHQMAHLCSAFYPSGFNNAMVVSYDGSGDKLSCVLARGRAREIEVLKTYPYSNSLGNFYQLITQFLGFEPAEGEYKVMGMAAYGKPGIDLSNLIAVTQEGYEFRNDFSYRSELPFVSYAVPFYSDRVLKVLGEPRRVDEPVSQRHKDIAYAAQSILEQCATALITHLHKLTGLDSLCLAGGVALNCSANLVLARLPFLRRLFIQPAASDRGLALGCALWGANEINELPPPSTDVFRCGPVYDNAKIRSALEQSGLAFEVVTNPAKVASSLIADGKIIGWFQGRSEYGPRALGHRSILANPRTPHIRDIINARIKFREEFRPFAPAVLEECANDYFEMGIMRSSPYMTVAMPVRPEHRHELEGVTHINSTARVQTVNSKVDPLFHSLIKSVGDLTGTPVVLNTSFNVRGQPIVETPSDAIATFTSCGMHALVIGNFVAKK